MENGTARIGEVFNYGILHLEWTTALFIVVVFFITMIILHNLLFRPILRTLEAREAETGKNDNRTEKSFKELELLQSDYESKLVVIREQIQQERQSALNEALEKANQIVETARTAITKEIEEAEGALAEERNSAMKEAESLVEGLAQLIKTKVLVN